MKINLLVDAAFAFDYVSILNIKYKESSTKENLLSLRACEKKYTGRNKKH